MRQAKDKQSPPNPTPTTGRQEAARAAEPRQPEGEGANRGSPAASVMKQFAKTKAESTGRP